MKEEEARIEDGHRLVMYVEKDDASYGPMETGSYMTHNYIDDFFEKLDHVKRESLRRLKAGEISPVAYYMILIEIGEGDLAARVGISRRRLRQHLKPEGFQKITLRELKRYADVFAVPVANMFEVIVPSKGMRVRQEKTADGVVVLTHIEKATE